MHINTDGTGGQPTNDRNECDTHKANPAYVTPPHMVELINQARAGDTRAEADLLAELNDECRTIAAAILGVSKNCDKIGEENGHLSEKEEQFVESQTLLWELLQEALHGNSGTYFTGFHKGRQISFVGHMKMVFRWAVLEKYHQDRRDVSRRVYRRFQKVVRDSNEHGVFDESAIPHARERVLAGDYKGIISVEMFDRCWHEGAPLSIHMEWATADDDEPNSIEQTLVSTVFDLPESTLEGRAAQDAFDKMPARWQEMLGRSSGLFGDPELHSDIGKDFGLSGQRVGQIVGKAKEHLVTAIDIARFDAGLPPMGN